MTLSPKQQRHLRSLAHHLRPVVIIGQHGLKESIFVEVDGALDAHELIKIRVAAVDKEERAELINQICSRSSAELVQRIGHVAVLFRRNPDQPKIDLPAV